MSSLRVVTMVVGGAALLAVGAALGVALGPVESGPEAPTPSYEPVVPEGSSPAARALAQGNPADSLVWFPYDSLINRSAEGTAAARLLIHYLDSGDRGSLERALDSYRRLHAVENFGGEYPTLQWFCEYELAGDAERQGMLEDPDGRRFVWMFGEDDWRQLRWYLEGKYGLARAEAAELRHVDEIVRFNSPYRATWERTDRVLELLDLQPGMQVADVGAGGGYFSYRFAEQVGPEGLVWAVETNDRHLATMRAVSDHEALRNLRLVPSSGAFPDLPAGSLDRVFLCSTYQAIYIALRAEERSAWLDAMLTALDGDGLVVVSENEPVVPAGVVPYRGISVSRPLIEAQLLAHGLELVHAEQPVPQRYLLVLRKSDQGTE